MAENKLAGLNKIHFIGIGGAGMSALAYVLLKRGYEVSGSDLKGSHMSSILSEQGAKVFIGHKACQVFAVDCVVVSTAIHEDNPELVEAKRSDLPILPRSDVLAALLNEGLGIAVAGAHGKTSTTSMLGCIAAESQVDPTVIIGGEVASLGGNAINGHGPFVIAEADESDGSFLKFFPHLEVITNIEDDHLDHYGTEENIYQAFKQFVDNLKAGGKAVVCIDNEKIKRLVKETAQEVITFGMVNSGADYIADDIVYDTKGTSYKIYCKEKFICQVQLIVPGLHNVLNSLGAFVAAREMGIPEEKILASLKKFAGAKRRFETKGRVKDIWVVDDYAHHPTEIAVTIKAALQTKPKRLLAVFQPHRYTRTQLLFNDFCKCFEGCDTLLITDIYEASEAPIPGVNSLVLAEGVKKATGQNVMYVPGLDQAEKYFAENAQPGDLVITIGAGNVVNIGEELVKELESKS